MIRTETQDGWILITHPEHAKLAGRFADSWGNEEFLFPEPQSQVREAVYAHDDGWIGRDATPMLTRQGKPSAFSKELVGTYSAFEEIDLADYLGVRGKALDAIAARNPYAAVAISMHTVNLLTEQADLSTIRPEDRPLHTQFIEEQRRRQRVLAETLQTDRDLAVHANAVSFDRAFRFLQCCDSFSLMACVSYEQPRALRHAQLKKDGTTAEVTCTPLGDGRYTLSPWPLNESRIELSITGKKLAQKQFASLEAFREAYRSAPEITLGIVLSPS